MPLSHHKTGQGWTRPRQTQGLHQSEESLSQ